jgi:signal transduction histidine kinase/transcriptional regulator with XRE-family HTH domain
VQPAQPPDLSRLGETIRERRRALGLTQAQLAERLGWTQERVSVLETGKYGLPSLPLLAHLSEALELPLAGLMEAAGFGVGSNADSHREAVSEAGTGGMGMVLSYTLQRLLGIQALTLEDAMNAASDLLTQAMGADKVDLFLHEVETQTLVALGTSNTPLGRLQHRVGLNRVPVASGGRQVEVFETGQPYYTGHADQDPEMDHGVVHTLGARSLYAVPLRVDGSIRGILVAVSVRPDRFSEQERDFFEAASGWVGMMAHRAELHTELTRRATEETRRMVAEEMLEAVAHDLRSQITPIKGQIDLMARRLRQAGDETRAAELMELSASVRRLNSMVNDLLDVSRLEGGIFSLARKSADLVELVRGVVESAKQDRPELEARVPDESLTVNVDPGKITQALQNLVNNAVQHTPEGVPVVITVGVEQREEGEQALVEVRDEGPGISAELLPRLFTRHTAGGQSAGLGLGLYLARGIATAHGGDLTVQSEPGQGTTFTLRLPI